MAKIGYARVSSKEQNLDRQLEALHIGTCGKCIVHDRTGASF